LLRKQQKTLGGYFFLPHPVHPSAKNCKTVHNNNSPQIKNGTSLLNKLETTCLSTAA